VHGEVRFVFEEGDLEFTGEKAFGQLRSLFGQRSGLKLITCRFDDF
jgi:hypothetical protein